VIKLFKKPWLRIVSPPTLTIVSILDFLAFSTGEIVIDNACRGLIGFSNSLFNNDTKGNKEYVRQIWEGWGLKLNPLSETGGSGISGYKRLDRKWTTTATPSVAASNP